MQNRRVPAFAIEPTSGNGKNECAYSAFILGLAQKKVLAGIDKKLASLGLDPNIEFHTFIAAAAAQLHTEVSWTAVKDGLIALKQNNKLKLQELLAPILLKLSMKLAREDNQHIERLYEPLFAALQTFALNAKQIAIQEVKEDIYKEHEFIQSKFAKLYQNFANDVHSINSVEYNLLKQKAAQRTEAENQKFHRMEAQLNQAIITQQEQLLLWWQRKGYHKFLAAMENNEKEAGDPELFQLANYFYVILDKKGDFDHRIHHANGTFPLYLLTQNKKDQLIVRGVINKPEAYEHGASLLPLTKREMEKRVRQVPEFVKVNQFILAVGAPEQLKTKLVPPEWSQECKQELQKRDVISKAVEAKFIVDSEVALSRIKAVEDKDQIEQVWVENFKEAPTITLHYANKHWSNIDITLLDAIQLEEQFLAYSQTELYKDTRQLFLFNEAKYDDKKLIFDAHERQRLEAQAELEENHQQNIEDPNSLITYSLFNGERKVSKDLLFKLDEQLAKETQLEECQKELQSKSDEQLAKELQLQENQLRPHQLQ